MMMKDHYKLPHAVAQPLPPPQQPAQGNSPPFVTWWWWWRRTTINSSNVTAVLITKAPAYWLHRDWRCLNSTPFKLQTFSADSKFDECFKHFVVECEFPAKSLFCDWFRMQKELESADKLVFFLKFNLSHKLQLLNVRHNFCLAMC